MTCVLSRDEEEFLHLSRSLGYNLDVLLTIPWNEVDRFASSRRVSSRLAPNDLEFTILGRV